MRHVASIIALTFAVALLPHAASADPPQPPPVKCTGGGLSSPPQFTQGSPGRAEYHFSGACITRDDRSLAYRVTGTWTPSENAHGNANASEVYHVDTVSGPSESHVGVVGWRCTADPWLHDVDCVRVGQDLPDALSLLWAGLAKGGGPSSRRGIPEDMRPALIVQYEHANGRLDRSALLKEGIRDEARAKYGAGSSDRLQDSTLDHQSLPPQTAQSQRTEAIVPATPETENAKAGIIIVGGRSGSAGYGTAGRKNESRHHADSEDAAATATAGAEHSMIQLQSLLSQRQALVAETMGMSGEMNESAKTIAGNIGAGGRMGANFAGTWSTPFGELTLRQEGTSVTGEYMQGHGSVSGTVTRGVLQGRWTRLPTRAEPDTAGDIEFTLLDPDHFRGCWRSGSSDDLRCDWAGARN